MPLVWVFYIELYLLEIWPCGGRFQAVANQDLESLAPVARDLL